LPEWAITTFTNHKMNIADCFGGTGTTLIAAEKLGEEAFVMELDPKYCDVIVERWEDYTGKKEYFRSDKMAQGKLHKPTEKDRETVKRLSALGVPMKIWPQGERLSSDTLVKYYKDELDEGRIDANAAMHWTFISTSVKRVILRRVFRLKNTGKMERNTS